MESVNISKKKYSELTELEITKSISNSEGRILVANLRNKIKVFKSLYRLNDDIYAEKLKTVALLDYYRDILPTSFVIPDSLCSVQGKIVGFSMELVKGHPLSSLLFDRRADYKLQLQYLKEVGKLLDSMDKIRRNTALDLIFINDLHPYNFVIDKETGALRTVDLDSCKIGDNKPFPAKFLSPKALLNYAINKYEIFFDPNNPDKDDAKYDYKKLFGYIVPNANSDIYCYIIMILNYLYGGYINNVSLEYFYNYIYYLESLDYNQELIDSFLKIISNCDNSLPIDVLDSLTSEQVYRAKKTVYDKTCK